MRDLNIDELEMVYGAGSSGRRCSPKPPKCGSKSKSSKKKSKSKKSKCKKSKSKSRKYC